MTKENLVIYNRKTGEIVNRLDVPKSSRRFRAFLFYYDTQVDKKNYGWKIQSSKLSKVS